MLRRLFTEGVCIDKDTFLEMMRPLCGDLTFAEVTLTRTRARTLTLTLTLTVTLTLTLTLP